MKQVIRPEVLAPAGDYERLIAAIKYGADAVYLGGTSFGMRASAGNFDDEQLRRGVAYAHEHGVRVYLTCNILPTNEEADRIEEFLLYAAEVGVDALIVADVGILMLARRVVPQIDIHISTQTGVVNYLTANELYRLGVKRVVLARELSLETIREIRRRTPADLEIECFVHGAMCMSFSGRCLLSNYLTGRDANRGECAQPCRWGYHLMEEKRPGQFFPVFEDESGSYILNAKDLSMIEYIDQLVDAGITSLKIEGRAKSAYYVSVITNAYRQAVDRYVADPEHYRLEGWLADEVFKVSHREYSTGFYFGRPDQCYQSGGYVRECDIVAVVEQCRDGRLYGTQRNRFLSGDRLEILEPGQPPYELTVEDIWNGDGEPVEAAPHAMMPFSIPCDRVFTQGTIIRKNKQQ
ncbi:MAG: U32 family peptidase [Clostridiales bacterium]|nr:U32 family peptidase [Clostridiales bacterium]